VRASAGAANLFRLIADTGVVVCVFPEENRVRVPYARKLMRPELVTAMVAAKEPLMQAVIEHGVEWDGTFYAFHPTHFGV
jgi:hypothetical protein